MKKDKKILLLIVFFAVLFFSHSALAGHGPNRCCILNHNLEDVTSTCAKGAKVGPKGWDTAKPEKYWCDTNDDNVNETPDGLTNKWGECCIIDSIYNITDWLFYILMAGVAIFYIAGAIFFLQASGDPNKVKQAQSFIFYGSIGLLLALMARIIPAILKAIVS